MEPSVTLQTQTSKQASVQKQPFGCSAELSSIYKMGGNCLKAKQNTNNYNKPLDTRKEKQWTIWRSSSQIQQVFSIQPQRSTLVLNATASSHLIQNKLEQTECSL